VGREVTTITTLAATMTMAGIIGPLGDIVSPRASIATSVAIFLPAGGRLHVVG
jgi:hypothetical protein